MRGPGRQPLGALLGAFLVLSSGGACRAAQPEGTGQEDLKAKASETWILSNAPLRKYAEGGFNTFYVVDLNRKLLQKIAAPTGLDHTYAVAADGSVLASYRRINWYFDSTDPWGRKHSNEKEDGLLFLTVTGVIGKEQRLKVNLDKALGGVARGTSVHDIEISRDGKHVYLSVEVRRMRGASLVIWTGIVRVEIATGKLEEVYRPVWEGKQPLFVAQFALSPDGKKMLVSELRPGTSWIQDLYVVDLGTKEKKKIPHDGKYAGNLSLKYAWLDGGESFVYAEDRPTGERAIYRAAMEDPRKVETIFRFRAEDPKRPDADGLSTAVAASPDGKKLLIGRTKLGQCLLDMKTGNLRVIQPRVNTTSHVSGAHGTHPSWSPDGRYAAYYFALASRKTRAMLWYLYVYDTESDRAARYGGFQHRRPVYFIQDPETVKRLKAVAEPYEPERKKR